MLLALLFVYTAATKILEHDRFVFQLRVSPLPLIVEFAVLWSWLVPLSEAFIAALLLTGIFVERWLAKGLWASLLLMWCFEIYIAAMFFSGRDLPCACGGIISRLSWEGHLFFNGLVILLNVLALTLYKARQIRADQKYLRA